MTLSMMTLSVTTLIRGNQYNDFQHNNTQHDDFQHNNTQYDDFQYNNIQYKDFWHSQCLAIVSRKAL
jgi:hypothetical protein